MGTESEEVIDDTSVLFAGSTGINQDRPTNGIQTNPAHALTHKLEKKLRTSKSPSSKSPVANSEMETDRPESSDNTKATLLPPSRLLIPAKTASDQPLVAYEIDSDEEIHFSRSSKLKMPSHKDATSTSRLLADDFDVELRSDEDDGDVLDLIRPQVSQPRCVCCKTACTIQ